MNKIQKNQKNRPKKACTTSINGTPPAPPAPMPQQELNHQTNKSDYQEAAAGYRRTHRKSKSFRGNCLCNGR